ncbi:MAG: DUF4381 domain-containing protein [Gammaproteobacteria bacterium]|nr:DUF4381 domain-containing protein [Gammaproteobacteria bacterium]
MNPDISALPLRDIHLPDGVSLWPLALGWWLLLALFIGVGVTILLWRYWRNQGRFRREALTVFHKIVADYKKDCNTLELTNQLSMLLRRLSVSVYFDLQCASLTGNAWLQFLDDIHAHKTKPQSMRFSSSYGEILINAPYRNRQSISQDDIQSLITLCQRWISALPPLQNKIDQHQYPYRQLPPMGRDTC